VPRHLRNSSEADSAASNTTVVRYLCLVLGVAAVVVAYWPALPGGLLWDDGAHLTAPELRSWSGLGLIWTEPGATQQYSPLLHSAFWIEHRLWGGAVLGYHLANLAQHLLAAARAARLREAIRRPPEP